MVGVVAVCAGFGSRGRVNRGLLEVRVIPGKIRVGFIKDIRDGAVGLQGLIAKWRNYCADRAGRALATAILDPCQFSELVVARDPQIPVAVENAGLCAPAELERVPSLGPSQAIGQTPAVLCKPLNLASLEGTS